MGSTVLLPVNNYAPWARSVAEVVTTIEDETTEAVVLHVFSEDELVSTRANLHDTVLSVDELASRKTGVGAAIEVLADNGIRVIPRGVGETDRTADGILSVVAEEHIDRIYMYSRDRSPAGKAVFGSTLQQVLFDSSVPVVVVPSNANRSPSRTEREL